MAVLYEAFVMICFFYFDIYQQFLVGVLSMEEVGAEHARPLDGTVTSHTTLASMISWFIPIHLSYIIC